MENYQKYKHSVSLNIEKCIGCTACLKHCPTEAIRIKRGHAVISPDRCIDCGECIRICPHKAKKAVSKPLESIQAYKYKVALPDPTLYGQFNNLDDIDYVIQGLVNIGFDEVYEVAKAAELVTAYTRTYIKRGNIPKPIISSACPVITRLISLRYPGLCENIMPLLPPMEVAGIYARKKVLQEHPELTDDDICICFISPCPAKSSYVNNSYSTADGKKKSSINLVVSMSEVYFALVSAMKKIDNIENSSQAGIIGLSWSSSGGESSAIFNDKYLAADGIDNVINVLEELDNGKMGELEFVELNACIGGCVGGSMTVENPFIARARLQTLRRYLPVTQTRTKSVDENIPDEIFCNELPSYRPISQLADNIADSMKLMQQIQDVCKQLPEIDCGSCGAPNCRAFAEDVVLHGVDINNCVINMKTYLIEKLEKLKEQSNDSK